MRLSFTLIFALFSCLAFSQNFNTGQIADRLLQRYQSQPEGRQSISILLADQLDILALEEQLTKRKADLATRAATLIPALQQQAASTQGHLLDYLHQSAGVDPGSVHPYWVTNVIFATVNAEVAAELSRMPEVAYLDWNAPLALSATQSEFSLTADFSPDGREIGLERIGAPALWAMGYTGYGRSAFTNDTGVDPSHPALKTRFRGYYLEIPEANWYQLNSDNTEPFDCDDHGTHVTGTMVGLDRLTNDTIGVAFNALWVGAATLCGIGTEDNVGAFQWALDPDNDPTTIEDMPDVINNSWYDPSIDNACDNVYIGILNSLETAGVAVVFSAGNEGPGQSTITNPHNINTSLVNTFTVGALNGAVPSLPIAGFSSQGPSLCFNPDSSLFIKPEVSAPGVSVRSCVPGGYGLKSGTSMAAPHVAGALLLLKEAFPYLSGKILKEALYFTALDLGQAGEDNTFGMGIIQVEEAFYYLLLQGNVPVDPQITNDVLLVDVMTQPWYCDGAVEAAVTVENGGTAPLTAFKVRFKLANSQSITEWTGNLAIGERVTVPIGPQSSSIGHQDLEVEVYAPNDQEDERPLNNKFMQSIQVLDRPFLQPFMQVAEGSLVCEQSEVVLRANHNGPGSVVFSWFDQAEGGNQLATGDAFVLGPVSETTTVYVDATYLQKVGLTNRAAGDNAISTEGDERGLVFDVYAPFKLNSVKVFSETPGLRIVKLLDAEGNTLKEKIVNVPDIGEQRISLGMNINPGLDLQLILELGAGLAFNLTGPQFPYEVTNVARIKQSNFPGGAAGLQRYYYFYDWEVEYQEVCGRSPITVEVVPAGDPPVAAFSMSTNLVDLATSDGTVQFTDNSIDAVSWFWDFGASATSTASNPSYQYSEPGIYYVSLSVVNAEGCVSSAVEEIEVIGPLSTGIRDRLETGLDIVLFPNPAQAQVRLQVSRLSSSAVGIKLMDVHGRLVREFNDLVGPEIVTDLSLGGLAPGIYYLVLQWPEGQTAQKLIVQ